MNFYVRILIFRGVLSGRFPDFTNNADKLRDHSQYLNNQRNITDQSKSVTDFLDAKIGLKEMRIRSLDKLILGHVNINSIKNNFDSTIL